VNLALTMLVLAQVGDSWDMQFVEPFTFDRQVTWIVLDASTHGAEDVARVKAAGARAICYVSVGTVEDWRPDLDRFPPEVIGKALPDWPGENYLDIRQIDDLLPIMEARFRACKEAGYDGVAPDNQDVFQNDSGFSLTTGHGLAYVRALADMAHGMDLIIAQRNLPEFSADLVGQMDFLLTEGCFEWNYCAEMAAYRQAGKPVFDVEYTDAGIDWAAACTEAKRLGISMILKDRALSGAVWETCR
jgi:hypothetical protein